LATETFDVTTHAFLFDVDGTLIDIAPTPDAVQVPATLRRNLDRLHALAGGAVALVSGRSMAVLDGLFAPLELSLVGGHGAEVRLRYGGTLEQHSVPPLDDFLRLQLARIAAVSEKVLFEDKGYSIALHYRLAPDREQAIVDAVDALCDHIPAREFEVLHGKFVVEVKRRGIDKGSGIRTLMRYPPFHGRRPIFIGDDITDEDAFAVMPEFDGIAMSVGRLVPGAVRRFEVPSDVRRWIDDLCSAHPMSR
jgi:trehalose 6-phosphate phosphatase